MNPAIVVVAFNRANSLKRLLNSIGNAYYEINNIPLVISIDKGNNQDVLDVAQEFKWIFGEKKINYQEENLKLRRHIIKCGDLSEEYGSVIILEDDLIVSPFFYQYASAALEFANDKEYIAGVSLYNHKWNVNVSEPFEIADDQYDGWYFQFASSWGEAWTSNQWKSFKCWYEKNELKDLHSSDMPDFVADWPSSSWLKYFIRFDVENNKYFLYPKKSLTSNFSDAGTHVNIDNTDYQVSLQEKSINYIFPELNESNCIYDVFFENCSIHRNLGYTKDEISIDLYGTKTKYSNRYLLSRRVLDFKIIKTYGCCLRPHENNIKYNIEGHDFFLYDTAIVEKNVYKYDSKKKISYNYRHIKIQDFLYVLELMVDSIKAGIKRRMNTIRHKRK